ncbi:RidA family protein [Dolosicoccus paucivorans]|uniref:Reactive intermediate/imine deaminase n=1 Tax=Dolosicoccus paucivorans TaxID=84521 RepID=A0A2N6SM17_9LACT|nr:Rid family detoxifying hydrolase [Dolosicoccus paucivorans]PMB84351.1 reactive intermediate/imine deaminase [Dolosicoccus paucivorans]PMC58100.1 reactive intermediate/imine deaminase [Dolosicoccus paucivorans]
MKDVINSSKAPEALGPYVHGRVLNGTAYLSGQLGVDPKTGELKEGIEAQTKQAFKNIEYVLESYGACLDDIVKVLIIITDIDNFGAVNDVYKTLFQEPYPARSMFAAKDLPKGAMLEVEVIADVSNVK